MSVTPRDPAYVLEQYEALRLEAMATRMPGLRGQGLAVFLSRGLPAWLAALTTLVPSARPEPPVPATLPVAGPRLLPPARAELTTVLAGMVLTCAHEPEVS